jgi:hypothetical protein
LAQLKDHPGRITALAFDTLPNVIGSCWLKLISDKAVYDEDAWTLGSCALL